MTTIDAPIVDIAESLKKLQITLSSVVRGKEEVIHQLVMALLAGGSVLLEDVPGVGKTTLAKALAASLDLDFQRIQCTPDLLPADVSGVSVFSPKDGEFHFRPGPIFCNLLLIDEINRASARTQSALLEVMAEHQVTVDGCRHAMEAPFFVVATQNPIGFHGTHSLPESQLDRFLIRIPMDYPDPENEVAMLFDQVERHPLDQIRTVLTKEQLLRCQEATRRVRVDHAVAQYIVAIANETRDPSKFRLGCSPRGSLMLFRASQAFALAQGRGFVLPDDVQAVAVAVLNHRLIPATGPGPIDSAGQIDRVLQILQQVPVPV